MDTLTHALSSALLYRAALGRERTRSAPLRERLRIAFLAAAFPDIDYAMSFIDPLTYLNLHQGITHSLVLMPVWALLLAVPAARWYGRRWRDFYGAALCGILAHIAGDLITAYGTQVLAPLSFERYAYPVAFVLDPYFTAIILTALWLPSRLAPRIGLTVLLAYVVLLAVLRTEARDPALAFAHGRGLEARHVAILPQPFTPLHWKLLVTEGSTVHEAHLRLAGGVPPAFGAWLFPETAAAFRARPELVFVAHPRFGADPRWAALAREAWLEPGFAGFRRFARYPALYRVDAGRAETCFWFTDRRYALPYMLPAFRFGMCRDTPAARWRLYRLRLFSEAARQRLD